MLDVLKRMICCRRKGGGKKIVIGWRGVLLWQETDDRQREETEGYAIIFFRADDVKPCGILYSLYTNIQI